MQRKQEIVVEKPLTAPAALAHKHIYKHLYISPDDSLSISFFKYMRQF